MVKSTCLAGNSAAGRGKYQEHLSRFSMPDLSKDPGINLSEKSHKDAIKSSVQFQSSESIHSLSASKPYMEIDPPRSNQYQLQYRDSAGAGKTRLPPGFNFQEDDRSSLASSVNAARLPPISERHVSGVGGGRAANIHLATPEDTPQRRRHHHHHHHHHSRRSRRSRSENALNLVADRRPRPQERPLLRVCEDYDRFPPPKSSRDRFGGGVGRYQPQPFRQCPRTTSDLTLQNPGASRRAGLNQYSWDEYDDGWCSTCSSSSESEDEGYFLGEPIPKPMQLRYLSNQELVHKYNSTGMGGSSRSGHLHARKHRKSKNCIIS